MVKKSKANIIIEKLPVIYAFEVELRLLFQNLISNAIKFSKPDVAPIVNIFSEEKESNYKFTVKDNGIGIDEKFKQKIFLIFQKLHQNNKYTGTGIGLAHCKKIVELHNGTIVVNSQLNLGSSFQFTISKNLT